MSLTKKVKELFSGTYETLIKEMEEYTQGKNVTISNAYARKELTLLKFPYYLK